MLHKDSQWYLVQCKPRESFRAEMHLKNQGYECFHPTHPAKRKVAGRVQYVPASLFPHYLFVLLNQTANSAPIRSTRGVSKMVHFNGVPACLGHDVINALKRHCAKLNGAPPEPIYKVGDKVVVIDGCFKDIQAIVTATSGEERVSLLLNLFNREQSVELPVSAVVGFE